MTTKLEQAARQALDALCNAVNPKHGFYYSLTEVPIDCAYKYQNAITALREALGNSLKPKCFADYQPNHAIDRACASCPVAAECQTGEQAEQSQLADATLEPVALSKTERDAKRYAYMNHPDFFEVCDLDSHLYRYRVGIQPTVKKGFPKPINQCIEGYGETLEAAIDMAIAAQQPVSEPVARVIVRSFNPMDASCPTTEVKWLKEPVPGFLYAAPVRTKNLTDDEVAKAYMECTGGDIIARCRAVIAADREKNNANNNT